MKLYESLKVVPLPKHRYRLVESYEYKGLLIPKGYETNGADIPRVFWSLYPPNRSDYLPAVVVHDYLCDLGFYDVADYWFKGMLEELEVSRVDVFVLWGKILGTDRNMRDTFLEFFKNSDGFRTH